MSRFWRRLVRGRGVQVPRPFSQGATRAPKPGDLIVLGGHKFRRIVESTVDHDFRFIRLLKECGLDEPWRFASEVPAEYAARLLKELLSSGRALEVLSFQLLPDGVPDRDWTPAIAGETASFLGALTAQPDKDQIYSLTTEFLLRFFQNELDSLETTRRFSGPGSMTAMKTMRMASSAAASPAMPMAGMGSGPN